MILDYCNIYCLYLQGAGKILELLLYENTAMVACILYVSEWKNGGLYKTDEGMLVLGL